MYFRQLTLILVSPNALSLVIFNNESTIVFWSDNTKTVVKCGDADIFDKEKGLAMAICGRKLWESKVTIMKNSRSGFRVKSRR